jgi:hypothetical protein
MYPRTARWVALTLDGERSLTMHSGDHRFDMGEVARMLGVPFPGRPAWGDMSPDSLLTARVMLLAVARRGDVTADDIGAWCLQMRDQLQHPAWSMRVADVERWHGLRMLEAVGHDIAFGGKT